MSRKIGASLQRVHRQEEGVTGLETAIILIAFVIVASVFAFVVLSTGLFSAERGKQTVLAGLEKASSNVELRGSVTINDLDDSDTINTADTIVFNLASAAAGRPVLIDPAATNNVLVFNFVTGTVREAQVAYTVNWINSGETPADNLLENGELVEISVIVPLTVTLNPNDEFTLEVLPPQGGSLLINRVLPPQIDAVMDMK